MTTDDINIHDPETYGRAVPHDQYAVLRAEAPVWFQAEPEGPGYWALTKHSDIVAVSRNPAVFSSQRGGINIPDASEEDLEVSALIMISMDPPQHAKYRRLVSTGFTPKMTRRLEDTIQAAVRGVCDRVEPSLRAGESVDFVQRIAAQVPLILIAELIGWPDEDRDKMYEWSDRVAQIDINPDDARDAALEFYQYCLDFIEAIEAGDRELPESLLKTLLVATVDGEKLSEMELVNFLLLLAIGGNETTRNCISGGFQALHDFPDQLALLLSDPETHLDGAVEEMLRWTSPIIAFRRTATQDTEVRGQAIKEGDKVVLYYASANRDEEVFPHPDRFDITRADNPHLTFGTGQHFCLGSTLARLEIRLLFKALLERFPTLTPTGEVERLKSNYVNGTIRLMARLSA